jgi:hypothetical protein|tara:strand:+ start:1909 stop:2358 length:450 start_codon:yes stop_codon:yes gene_type:complete
MKKLSKYGKIMRAVAKSPNKSNKEIAAQVGVSASYVYKVKSSLNKLVTADEITTDNDKAEFTPTQIALANRLGRKLLAVSDGSTAAYYELPEGAKELQDLISHRNMNAQIGEIFRACYRYGIASHSDELRDAKKIKFYIDAEIKRLEKL